MYYTGKADDKLNVWKHGITAKKSRNKTQQPLRYSSETYLRKTRGYWEWRNKRNISFSYQSHIFLTLWPICSPQKDIKNTYHFMTSPYKG